MSNEEKILNLLSQMQADISGIKTDQQAMKADITGLKADVSGIRADQQAMKTDITGLKADISGIKTRLDVEITGQLKLLAEGQQTLLETMAPKSRVEALEDEMTFLKSVIKSMGQRISALEKAQ